VSVSRHRRARGDANQYARLRPILSACCAIASDGGSGDASPRHGKRTKRPRNAVALPPAAAAVKEPDVTGFMFGLDQRKDEYFPEGGNAHVDNWYKWLAARASGGSRAPHA
jgi:hypothetical protein